MQLIKKILLCASFFAPAAMNAETKVEVYQNGAVKKIRSIIDEWTVNLLREYPYLYVFQGETDYNTLFEKDPDSFVLFAEKDGHKIGILEANPLDSKFLQNSDYTPYHHVDQIRKKGFDPSKILYVTCFMMAKGERKNKEAINLLFNKAVELAKKMGKTQICYMEVVEDAKHPLKPSPYVPLEPWGELEKRSKSMNVEMEMSWPTLQPNGEVKEQSHKMAFYVIDI